MAVVSPMPPLCASDQRLYPATDYWHATPAGARVPPGFKEWSHFSVLADDFDLLANFSLTEALSPSPKAPLVPRLTLLFRDQYGHWDGDVENFKLDQTRMAEGDPDVAFGCNSARFIDGSYRIELTLPARGIEASLRLQPLAHPTVANNIRLSESESFRWVVVPNLGASGEVSAPGRRYTVADAPAYHDRNTGCFAWGGGFTWEWATILPVDPAEPWSLSYSRIANRERGVTLSQSLMLWRQTALFRKFYGRDLAIACPSRLSQSPALRLPRVAALLVPGTAADVPRHLQVDASAYGDAVSLHMRFDDFAQIIIPNDAWPGVTTLSEIRGSAMVTGRIGDEAVAFDARVQAELNHASC